MLNRVSALCAFGIALLAQSLQAQPDLFVLPGAAASNGVVESFVTNPVTASVPVALTNFRTLTAGLGAFAVLPNLSGSTLYIVASSPTNSIEAVSGTTFLPLLSAPVANLSPSVTQAIMTPNGQLLVVAAGAVHFYNTTSNSEVTGSPVSQGSGINTMSIAASLDSTQIFALGSTSLVSSQLNSISTSSFAIAATLALSEAATAVSVGPNGLVYVSMPGQIVEVDPHTLTPTPNGTIAVSGTPGRLVFTPDGQYALGINQSLTSGSNLIIVSLPTHTAIQSTLGIQGLTSLQVIGVETVLGVSSQGLYKIAISPLAASQLVIPGLSGDITAAAITNDVPSTSHSTVQSAYLGSAGGVYEFNPATQAFLGPYTLASNITQVGAMAYAVPALTTSTAQPASLLAYGTIQSIAPGATSEPLVVQVLDQDNVPISGVNVQFQSSGDGATVSPASTITGSNGYAVSYLTASATTGPVIVTGSVSSLNTILKTSYSVNVSSTIQTGSGGPTLSIVAGQGQLMQANTSTSLGTGYGTSLQVLASDANGNPIANLPVTFALPLLGGGIQMLGGGPGAPSQIVNTNADGIASVDFETTQVTGTALQQGYLQTPVTATATNSNSVTFYITTFNRGSTPSVVFVKPKPGATLTGAEGSILPGAVEVQVQAFASSSIPAGIPNIALTLIDSNPNPSVYPTASCNAPGGVVLSNDQGIASCDVLFGPRITTEQTQTTFIANAGVNYNSAKVPFSVTPGAPATIQIVQGNNQTGGPGQTLPVALVIHVTDSGGNTVTGAPVNWQVVTAGTVTLSNVINATNSVGDASALATLGTIGGSAQVTVTSGSASATFNLTVNIPTAGLQKVSGDQQTTKINTAFALPLTVKAVDSSGNAVTGVPVSFQVTAGAATLGPSSAVTSSTGQASTTVTAGATAGAITVTATSSTFSVTFTLTALLPGPANITIVNGASFDPNTGISLGGIALIRGVGILPGVSGVVPAPITNGQYPTTFSGVTITFNGTPAPIYYVEDTNGADTLSVQVPFEVQPGPTVSLEVSVANEGSASVMVPVKPVAPGVFTSTYGGKIYAVAVRPDGSQVSPTNPAQRGENIQLYITGLGQATPTIATNTAGVPDQTIVSPLVVGLNNGGVPLISAVYAPGLIGVYIVILQVPADTQTGPYQPIGVIAYDSSNNAYFAQPTYIPIQ
jgi:uncharacterized protein (TIGR03437 family)